MTLPKSLPNQCDVYLLDQSLDFTKERSQFNITKIDLTNFNMSSVSNPIQFIVDGKDNDILINLNSSWMTLLKQNFH